ncbi:hypothetical protein CJ030_MR7G011661 [Morella rubra]|uniref:Uncharacterized protein n=1 Tax=Morella rubra TaxID=262757 RepID=A0A6A1V278_9ROSI|nr:hypothetical protein CJ030_MR7G011661 [Morella rubra]
MILEGRSSEGWKAFVMTYEEVISAVGELRWRKKGPVDSMVRKRISFVDMAKNGLPEKTTMRKEEIRKAAADVGGMQMLESVGVPLEPNANNVGGLVIPESYDCSGVSDLAAGFDGVVWEHLMKLKAKVDGLIGLVKNRKVAFPPSVGPKMDLRCKVCGFKMVAEDIVGEAMCPPLRGKEDCHLNLSSLDWVLEMVSFFKDMVGLSCNGHESELMALFATLEKDRGNNGLVTSSKSGGKFLRELKGFKSSINYDGKQYVSRKSCKGRRVSIKSL